MVKKKKHSESGGFTRTHVRPLRLTMNEVMSSVAKTKMWVSHPTLCLTLPSEVEKFFNFLHINACVSQSGGG